VQDITPLCLLAKAVGGRMTERASKLALTTAGMAEAPAIASVN
jgi:hypothetical protein